MTLDIHTIVQNLVAANVLTSGDSIVTRLAGGVSSDIYLIEAGGRKVVVKQALRKLKVKDRWEVSTRRNITEQHFIRDVSSFLPRAVPCLLHCDEENHYFAMEYLDDLREWKSELMSGIANAGIAEQAGRLMGTIHNHTWDDPVYARRFDTVSSFNALRIDPYLLTTARRHPVLQHQIQAEAARLEQSRSCLIHGDFSPKNIMVGPGRMVLLDGEVAWFGEPAFDMAFLLNHFLLKALVHRGRHGPFLDLVSKAWTAYQACLNVEDRDIEQRTGRLLLMLMLARVDGKSPAEYIDVEFDKQIIRSFVYEHLPRQAFSLADICCRWGAILGRQKK